MKIDGGTYAENFLRGEAGNEDCVFWPERDLLLIRALMSKLAAYEWNRLRLQVQAPALTN